MSALHARLLLVLLLADTSPAFARTISTGVASWYGCWHDGKLMANGRPFHPAALSAASPHLPLGTRIRVTNLHNGRSVDLTVTDRGPVSSRSRVLDLSLAAARVLGMIDEGLAVVTIELLP